MVTARAEARPVRYATGGMATRVTARDGNLRMMFDASALTKRYATEPGRERILALFGAAGELVVAAHCQTEGSRNPSRTSWRSQVRSPRFGHWIVSKPSPATSTVWRVTLQSGRQWFWRRRANFRASLMLGLKSRISRISGL